jgi:hypothetical protein
MLYVGSISENAYACLGEETYRGTGPSSRDAPQDLENLRLIPGSRLKIRGSRESSGNLGADPQILGEVLETFPLIPGSCARSPELAADPGILARDGEILREIWRVRGRSADVGPDPGNLWRSPRISAEIGRSRARSREFAADREILRQIPGSWGRSGGLRLQTGEGVRGAKKGGTRCASPEVSKIWKVGSRRRCRGCPAERAASAPPGPAWLCADGHGTAGGRSGPASPSGCRSGASPPNGGRWPVASLQ